MTNPAEYTRPCDGSCGDESPHNAHLTEAGLAHYTQGEAVPETAEPQTSEEEFNSEEKNLFSQADSVDAVLGMLAGFASTCWMTIRVPNKYSIENERVFDSENASKGVQHALARLSELGYSAPEQEEEPFEVVSDPIVINPAAVVVEDETVPADPEPSKLNAGVVEEPITDGPIYDRLVAEESPTPEEEPATEESTEEAPIEVEAPAPDFTQEEVVADAPFENNEENN